MHLSIERVTNLIVTVKEIPLSEITAVSDELLVYKELEASQLKKVGVLCLYQTLINSQSYVLVKEPYTATLEESSL